MGFFNFFKRDISEEEFQEQQKVKRGLEKTRTGFFQSIVNTLTNAQIDDDLYDQLEEQLILADVGPACAVRLVDELQDEVKEKHLKTGQEALDALRGIICQELTPRYPMDLDGKPAVILVIGVNGVGKTTTIAKLAGLYKKQGRRVMLAAGDTFRAAASEQLELWAERADVPLVQAGMGADPAAVIFDAVKSANARGYDMVSCIFSFPGSHQSSQSKKAIYSPLACLTPRLRLSATPILCLLCSTVISDRSMYGDKASARQSVEPSSTMIISNGTSCIKAESIACAI